MITVIAQCQNRIRNGVVRLCFRLQCPDLKLYPMPIIMSWKYHRLLPVTSDGGIEGDLKSEEGVMMDGTMTSQVLLSHIHIEL